MTEPLAHSVAGAANVGQRRLLTVLFVDLSGSTAMAEWMEAEHYAEMLGGLRALYERIVPHHGGVVVRIQGDGMLAMFGYPDVREDDGRRAAEAALELHAAARELVPPGPKPADFAGLALHSGIHAGIVLLNEGDQMRGRFELLGNTPNIAARLSEAARRDEIIASEESLGLQSQCFDTGPRFTMQLRGRAAPLAVYRVAGRAPASQRLAPGVCRGHSPFVGRGGALATLEMALARTLAGRTLWLGLRAEAGMGKTRLVEEFLRHAQARAEHAGYACPIHRGCCERGLGAEPLQPFMQMLRALAPLADAPPELLAAQHSAPAERADAALAALLALARRAPQVICIDDLQWADDASLRLLHRLRDSAGRERLPMLLLTASRGQPASAPLGANDLGAELVELPPLSAADAVRAVHLLLPAIDPAIASEVQRHAGGNPLFIEALCHAVADSGDALAAGPVDAAGLAALVRSRVDRLPPEQAQLVRIAAVIGNVVPVWLLQTLSGCGEQHPTVQALAAQGLLLAGPHPGHLRFKHGIARDVAYQAIPLQERQALHRCISAALAGRDAGQAHPPHALLAHHGAAAHDWHAAAHHAEAAGDEALAASALDLARQQFRAALAALDLLDERGDNAAQVRERQRRWIRIARRLGSACTSDASPDDLRLLRRAAGLARAVGDDHLVARTAWWLARTGHALGDARSSLHHAHAAHQAAQRCGDAALLARMPATLGPLHAAAAQYASALPMLDTAIAGHRQRAGRSAAHRAGLSSALGCRACVLGDQGHFAQAHALIDEALAPFDGSGHAAEAGLQACRAVLLLWQGRWAEAREAALVAHRIGAQVRSPWACAMGHAAGAYGAWMHARDPLARQRLLDATAGLGSHGGGLCGSLGHGWLADVLAEQGGAGAARHHVALALQRARQRDWLGAPTAYRAAARLASRQGDVPGAQRYLALARRAGEQRQARHEAAVTALVQAELKLDAGWPAALARANAEFERMQMPGFLARAQALLPQR